MDRKGFLSVFGVGLAAACTGVCLASCKKSDTASNPPGGGGSAPAGVNFTIDLNNDIKTIGESITKGGVIVVRLAQGNATTAFTAVQVACTHQGTAIGFNTSQGNFVCPNHGSQFATSGAVLTGPATTSLKKYNIAIAGSTMTVTA